MGEVSHTDETATTAGVSPSTFVGGRARLAQIAQVDFHVAATLFFRCWNVVAGAITLLAIPLWLGKVEQGYYYTFASILALQVFFELGLNQVLVQIIGHEVARLQPLPRGGFTGPAQALDRLSALGKLTRRWYGIVALLFAALVGCFGAYFLGVGRQLPLHDWIGPWALMVLSTSVNLYLSPGLAIAEGCGQMGQVARLRAVQSLLGYLCFWLALSLHAALWAVVFVPMAAALCTAYWLNRGHSVRSWLLARAQETAASIGWRTEIFPFQWRIAVSWISGYFIFQLFTPLIFLHRGAVEAGRIGMALSIFNAVTSIGMSWVTVKVPEFTALIASGRRGLLNSLFLRVTKRAMAFVALGCLCIVAGTLLMRVLGWELASRIAPIPVLLGLSLVTLTNTFIFSAATYMRAHKEEPMLQQSMAMAVCVLAAAYWGARWGTGWVIALYAAITLGLSLPWTLATFRRYFRREAVA